MSEQRRHTSVEALKARVPRARRGANAIEFALVSPILFMFLGGIMNWGWFFFEDARVVQAVAHGARQGSIEMPVSGDATGDCALCRTHAESTMQTDLNLIGITGVTNNTVFCSEGPTSVCAIKMTPIIPYNTPVHIMQYVIPTPTSFPVKVRVFTENVTDCPTAC